MIMSTKTFEFIIKSHASSDKARTLAQIVEWTYELTGLSWQYRNVPTCEKELPYVSIGFFGEVTTISVVV